MGPERKLYQKVKKNITSISWIRLENLSLSGTPDLLGYNNSGTFFTIELKVTKSNKPQASSPLAKGSSAKPQASSAKIPEPGNK